MKQSGIVIISGNKSVVLIKDILCCRRGLLFAMSPSSLMKKDKFYGCSKHAPCVLHACSMLVLCVLPGMFHVCSKCVLLMFRIMPAWT